MSFWCPALLGLTLLGAPSPPASAPPSKAAAPALRPQIRLEMELSRTDGATGRSGTAPAPVVLAAPTLTTLDRTPGSISTTGGDLAYAISVSPTREAADRLALLWTLQLSGTSLPGAQSVRVTGTVRVRVGSQEPVTEVTLRNPQSGQRATFTLRVRAQITDAAAPAATPTATPPAPAAEQP